MLELVLFVVVSGTSKRSSLNNKVSCLINLVNVMKVKIFTNFLNSLSGSLYLVIFLIISPQELDFLW